MSGNKFRFLVVPASTVFAAAVTGLYLVYCADVVADGVGYGLALALPVLASLIWGGGVSFLCTKGVQVVPVLLSGGASVVVIGWVLFAISRIH